MVFVQNCHEHLYYIPFSLQMQAGRAFFSFFSTFAQSGGINVVKNDRGVFRGHSGIWVCFLSGPLSGCAAFASVSATGCRTFCHPSDPGLFPGCPASFFARDAFHAGAATAGVGGGNSLCRCGKRKRFASAGKVFCAGTERGSNPRAAESDVRLSPGANSTRPRERFFAQAQSA